MSEPVPCAGCGGLGHIEPGSLCPGCQKCRECAGRTVEFRGHGKDTQRKLCSRWREPGHLSEAEVREKVRAVMEAVMPSGRWA